MYAVIRTGGKQYRVAPDQELQIEKIDAAEGERIEFADVLMLSKDGGDVQVGAPVIEGARVAAEVVEQGRGEKIVIFKKKRRKNYRRKNGHRQWLTTIRVLELLGAGDKPRKKPGEGTASAKKQTGGSAQANEAKSAGKKAEGSAAESKTGAGKSKKQTAQKQQSAPASGFEKLSGPQGEPDNLKNLPGVGPKLAEKLNDYGIFHFSQLAAMNEDDIQEMDAALDLRGRATRDNWVGQARQMAQEQTS